MSILKNKKPILIISGIFLLGALTGWLIGSSSQKDQPAPIAPIAQEHEEHEDRIWTCSMHPQIRQSEPGNCPICGMELIPVGERISELKSDPMIYEMPEEALAMARIQTSKVTRVSPEGELLLTGTIEADERQLASITANFPGRIERLFVSFTGQMVQKGERLATIYSPELVTAQNELLEAADTKEEFPELYDAARDRLRLWNLTERQINQIEQHGEIRERFDVLADRRGIVTQRNISIGDYVSTGTVLFNVADLSRVWVMIDAYETDLPFIRIGDEVSFTVSALPGRDFDGKIAYIDPVIDQDTRAASVRVETVNPDLGIKPGMFVNARVFSSALNVGPVSIPRTALLWSGKRSIVYVKIPYAKIPAFEMREISIGPRLGDKYIVEGGLDVGEEVVTNGAFAIDAAAQLSGNYSLLMRPTPKTMDVPHVFRQQLTEVAQAYFNLKNNLFDSDFAAAKRSLDSLSVALGNVDMSVLNAKAHDQWMLLLNHMKGNLHKMNEADDLQNLRKHFAMLSANVIEMVEFFGIEKQKVYKNYCSAALKEEGAYWLSEFEQIRNPYLGKKEPTCGEVREVYRKGQRVFKDEEPMERQDPGHAH
jgi:membrane fusion protein, copper/silver efflux system